MAFVKDHLAWARLYRTTSYLKSALWTVPLVAIVLEMVLAPLIRELDAWLRWRFSGSNRRVQQRCIRPSSR